MGAIGSAIGEQRVLFAVGGQKREAMALPDRQNPFHRFPENAASDLLSLPSNLSASFSEAMSKSI